jgi:molybdate transport system substrate-binding protein
MEPVPLAFPSLKRSLAACLLAGLASAAMAGDITVSAAASLTNAFKDIAQGYEAAHPGSKVLLNFGASGALLQQMAKGAPVDVFASADQETMDMAQQQGLVRAGDRQDFARNTLVVVAPVDAKAPPAALKDLAAPGVARVALALPASVPVGRYAKHALEAAGLWSAVQAKAVNTTNVRQSLDYVARHLADCRHRIPARQQVACTQSSVGCAIPRWPRLPLADDLPARQAVPGLARRAGTEASGRARTEAGQGLENPTHRAAWRLAFCPASVVS